MSALRHRPRAYVSILKFDEFAHAVGMLTALNAYVVSALLLRGRLASDHSASDVAAISGKSRGGGNPVMRFMGASA